MSEFTRCQPCQGRKVLTGLGMIQKKCPYCLGEGQVAIKDTHTKVEPFANTVVIIEKPVKKRGRPKRE